MTGAYSSNRNFEENNVFVFSINTKNRFVTNKDIPFCENVFCRADTIREGNNFIIGNHFHTFIEFWNNMERYERKQIEKQFAFVEARNIEGVFLSDKEMSDPNMFWSHKNPGEYSKESMLSRTQYLPEIYFLLNRGADIGLIMDDERLGVCVKSYFNSPVRVSKLQDTYVFRGDGRHRIIAAQSLGCMIPVYVEEIIYKK